MHRDSDGAIRGTDAAEYLHGTAQDADLSLVSGGNAIVDGSGGLDRVDFTHGRRRSGSIWRQSVGAGTLSVLLLVGIEAVWATAFADTI